MVPRGIKWHAVTLWFSAQLVQRVISRLCAADRKMVIRRLQAGHSAIMVTNHFRVLVSIKTSLGRRFQAFMNTGDHLLTGRRRVTSSRHDRHIVAQNRSDHFRPVTQTSWMTIRGHWKPVSIQTVRRRHHHGDLQYCRPADHLILTPRHRQQRLLWEQHRQIWTQRQ